MKAWIADENGHKLIGAVPPGWTVEVYSGGRADLPSDPATLEFWNAPFLATGAVVGLLERMPALRVVQLMSAGVDAWLGKVSDHVTLCDARGVHDSGTAEWAAGCEARRVIVRPFQGTGARVTIGTAEENDRFLEAARELA